MNRAFLCVAYTIRLKALKFPQPFPNYSLTEHKFHNETLSYKQLTYLRNSSSV
jgi:hypothetical protein